ncbi:MAG: prolipoprotein diacylglyceryl transferase [Actinomycetota bacterium]|nr:prolipoprotein diacylglyceryl transferase [Actinomycetota bacterium]
MRHVAVITIGIPPEIHLGPLTLAWHGITIAVGILLGGLAASRWLRARGMDVDPLYNIAMLLTLGGIVGGRLFYVLERGGPLLGTKGFTFDGGFIAAGLLLALYVRRARLDVRYLDGVALALPLGIAIGRLGDVINGEHYGAQSTSLLAVRNSHPDALTPNAAVAFENGGLYEVLLGLAVLVVLWPLRDRLPRAGDLAWLVVALFAVGRFFVFFLRSDSPELALGLSNAQWTSVAILLFAGTGRSLAARRGERAPPPESRGAKPVADT